MNQTLASCPFDLNSFYTAEWEEHFTTAQKTQKALFESFSLWVEAGASILRQGKKILFFGNGGSAADAQHLATELTVRFKTNRKALPALALTTDTSTLTAIGNDLGFDQLFARQIEALGQEGDMAIGISTSGKSSNVLNGFKEARRKKIITVGLTGGKGGKLPDLSDILLTIPSQTTARIQEMHITLGQMFCAALEIKLGLV